MHGPLLIDSRPAALAYRVRVCVRAACAACLKWLSDRTRGWWAMPWRWLQRPHVVHGSGAHAEVFWVQVIVLLEAPL